MRILLACLVIAGCADAADVPTTVVHVELSSSCSTPDCFAARVFGDNYCGPDGDTEVTPTTRELEVLSDHDAKDIAGYIQLQYRDEDHGDGHYHDRVLGEGETLDVYAAWGGDVLYRLGAAGEPVDIATDKLMTRDGSTLTFAYDVAPASVVEVHHIDAPRTLRVEADSPGLMDACCSAGRTQDGALVATLIIGGLWIGRRRRSAQREPGRA